MFACAMYPRDDPFLRDVAEEARQQTLRLSSHPSIIVWGGNNENEAAFNWFDDTKANPHLYSVDYAVLFTDLLRRVLNDTNPTALYLDSSPSKGLLSRDPYVKRWGDVTNPDTGDVHFYDYNSNLFDTGAFPPAKFVSEFGYMSYPSFDTFASASKVEDWMADSPLMQFRMRHADGLEQLRRQLSMHFEQQEPSANAASSGTTTRPREPDTSGTHVEVVNGWPVVKKGAASDGSAAMFARPAPHVWGSQAGEEGFRRFTYLTQVQQALIYSTGASRWRCGKSDPAVATAGLLYWQLNDVWAGPSWSSVNVDGRWKPLNHAAKRFFAPLAVFGVVVPVGAAAQTLQVEACLVNDLPVDVIGRLTVSAVHFNATAAADVVTLADIRQVSVPAATAGAAWQAAVPLSNNIIVDGLSGLPPGFASTHLLMFEFQPQPVRSMQSSDANLGDDQAWDPLTQRSTSELLLVEPGDAHLGTPNVIVDAVDAAALTDVGDPTFNITLRAEDGIALHVVLESPVPGVFSDNMFMLAPWEDKVVQFQPASQADPANLVVSTFQASLKVTWLQAALEQEGHTAPMTSRAERLGALSVLASLWLLTAACAMF